MKPRPGTILLLLLAVTVLPSQSPTLPSAAPTDSSQNQDAKSSQSDTPSTPTTVLKATTHLVVVDVIALDSKGEPVTGLKEDDFTLLDNGKPQEIRVFNFQHPEQTSPALPPLPANVFTNVPRYRQNTPLNVILMDGLNTGFGHSADMRRAALDFLRKLSRDEPVAIYGLGRKLELLQDFTTPPRRAQGVTQSPAGGTFSADMFRDVPESEMKIEQFMPNTQALSICGRDQITVRALHWIVSSLAGLPGRKNLIWISDNFPFGIYTALNQYANHCLINNSKELSETVEEMLDRQIAVYPIVATGLENHDFDAGGSVGVQGLVGGQRFANGVAGSGVARAVQITRINDLAHRTGGEVFHDRNDLDMAIRSSIDDGSTYYTLGYYPSNKNWDGQFRTIQVKMKRDGVNLRYRLGYFATEGGPVIEHDAKSRGKAMNEALGLEVPAATSLLFEATFEAPSAKTGNKALVKFAIDARGLNFERSGDQIEHASVDCVVKVYSPQGALITTESSTMDAKLKPDTFSKVMQTSFPCRQSVALRPGSYLLKLGVIDNHTGLLGTASGKIRVN